MRKSIKVLSMLVEGALELDPFSGYLFVFSNRRRNIVKVLYWGVPRTFVRKTSGAVFKMREGPSKSVFRSRFQTTHCCYA